MEILVAIFLLFIFIGYLSDFGLFSIFRKRNINEKEQSPTSSIPIFNDSNFKSKRISQKIPTDKLMTLIKNRLTSKQISDLDRENEKDYEKLNSLLNELHKKRMDSYENRKNNSECNYTEYNKLVVDYDQDLGDESDDIYTSTNDIRIETIKINDHPVRKDIIEMGFINSDLCVPDFNLDSDYECERLPFQRDKQILEYKRMKEKRLNKESDQGEGKFRVNLN